MSSIQSVIVSLPLLDTTIGWLQGRVNSTDLLSLPLALLHFIGLIVIAVGAAKMGFLESRRLGLVGAWLACIPFATPFLIVGIPFGIWSLRLMQAPDVQAAFETVAKERRSKAKIQTGR